MNARALQVTLETCNYEEYLHVQMMTLIEKNMKVLISLLLSMIELIVRC